jgi:hypothetical protein
LKAGAQMKVTRLLGLLSALVFLLASCVRQSGQGFVEKKTLETYGFFDMPKPKFIEDDQYVVKESHIIYEGMMTFDAFQSYSIGLFNYYHQHQEVNYIGLVDRVSVMGMFETVYLRASDALIIDNELEYEDTNVTYAFVFSTLLPEGTNRLYEARVVKLSYYPKHSVSGSNVKIELIKSSLSSFVLISENEAVEVPACRYSFST